MPDAPSLDTPLLDVSDVASDLVAADREVPCVTGTTRCLGVCVDLDRDPSNCGACGRSCAPSRCCARGVCGLACSPAYSDCDGDCANGCETNVNTDVRNCGACGNACLTRPGFITRCVSGVCTGMACENADCDGDPTNGRETNLLTDACNCGACGRRCESLRGVATATCEACACRFTCHATYGDCDHDPSNGCEVALSSGVVHCGACGHACAAGQACRGGACVDVPSYTACPGRMANLRNDLENCGACGRACGTGQVCDNGVCAPSCAGGSIQCGSETCIELGTNPLHCGACGRQCPAGLSCSFGRCTSACPAGLTVCSGSCVNTMTDPMNCGLCGQTCPLGASCVAGACQSRNCR